MSEGAGKLRMGQKKETQPWGTPLKVTEEKDSGAGVWERSRQGVGGRGVLIPGGSNTACLRDKKVPEVALLPNPKVPPSVPPKDSPDVITGLANVHKDHQGAHSWN